MRERKNIFITGGGSGIGRAIAQRFARGGWFVGLADINRAGMEETAASLPDGQSSIHMLDVRDPKQWEEALAAFSQAAGGRIDALANNAGVPLGGDLAKLTTEEIDRTLAINLNGVIYGARAAYPHLKAAAPGSCLVNTCSAAGLYGQAGMTVYCASKFGVRAITEALDVEWAADDIRVTDVMPSFIDTPLLAQSSHAADNRPIRDRVSAAGLEFTPVEDVAETFWNAVHGKKLHNPIGKTANKIMLAARWLPSYIRGKSRQLARDGLKPMG
ncbi:SDR family oxidoreductase [Aurantiacibacter gangjinensis]|uniref:Short-chain dehydrogenase n=1 Tax=Aurantiacibacter gangjinensis TaxID=502682 RepID=A0A0G9MRU0_9SPHN|nr:SDR family oxidoreductase [Aurantiacibacter gangjinensis]APE27023.1 short chain dehydrogenase family protein [Aurantiacibacter gangjinensis]KLE33461.1 short-chain dehydrogenase [Aurantiacibacter gangjinensis]